MGLSASQGRLLLLTARRSDLEFRAQQISQKRLILSQQLEEISMEYENATSNRQMKIGLFTGNEDTNEYGTKYINLTYANLVLGTLNSKMNPLDTGIQAGNLVVPEGFSSENLFRLVDADGAIVIPDASMIPNSITSTNTKETVSTSDKNGVYTQTDLNGAKSYYIKSPESNKEKDKNKQNLGAFLENEGVNKENVEYNENKGIIKLILGNTPYYFNTKTGKQITKDNNSEKNGDKPIDPATYFDEENEISDKNLNILNYGEEVPKSKKTTSITYVNNSPISPGQDGKFTIDFVNEDGEKISYTYFIDPALKYGGTDAAGSKTSPNYLQDCLRSGKYLLESGKENSDTNEFEWHSISWDAVAGISDSYYTEDDDAAKAKYDRLQAQIQAQDKKLELELDNIETQRQAVTTEVESVEKVIQENIEGSFNAFG